MNLRNTFNSNLDYILKYTEDIKIIFIFQQWIGTLLGYENAFIYPNTNNNEIEQKFYLGSFQLNSFEKKPFFGLSYVYILSRSFLYI